MPCSPKNHPRCTPSCRTVTCRELKMNRTERATGSQRHRTSAQWLIAAKGRPPEFPTAGPRHHQSSRPTKTGSKTLGATQTNRLLTNAWTIFILCTENMMTLTRKASSIYHKVAALQENKLLWLLFPSQVGLMGQSPMKNYVQDISYNWSIWVSLTWKSKKL